MSRSDTQQALVGAVVCGVSILSGNAALMTVATGMGINWTSEGLSRLWQQHAAPRLAPDAPLARAYAQALRKGVRTLRDDYRQRIDSRSDLRPFTLLETCAASVAQAQFPTAATEVPDAQRELARSLDDLLHGHDERQVRYLQTHLLAAVTDAFQNELATNQAAWNQFHGWLIQQSSSQIALLTQSLTHVSDVLERFRDTASVQARLEATTTHLEAQLHEVQEALRRRADAGQPATPPPAAVFFSNIRIQADTTIQTAAGTVPAVTPGTTLFRNEDSTFGTLHQRVGDASPPPPAPNPDASPTSAAHNNHLRQVLTTHFNESELRTLCFTLGGVDYESLCSGGKADHARELVAYCQRHGRLDELAAQVWALRPLAFGGK